MNEYAPRLCHVLGVEPSQRFKVIDDETGCCYIDEIFFIDEYGYMECCTENADINDCFTALLYAINNPLCVERIQSVWTQDDSKDAEAISRLCPFSHAIRRRSDDERIEVKNVLYQVEWIFPKRMVKSLKVSDGWVFIREIIDSKGESDET